MLKSARGNASRGQQGIRIMSWRKMMPVTSLQLYEPIAFVDILAELLLGGAN